MKKRLIKTVIAFLLLVPFRLTISVVLISLFTWTATIHGKSVPNEVISASVLTSKICYDLFVGVWLCVTTFNIYLSLATTAEKDRYGDLIVKEWYLPATIFTCAGVIAFIASDIYLTNELFWHFVKQ